MALRITIRNASPDDYERVIPHINSWWGGRNMVPMLPRLFFSHFSRWVYVAEQNGSLIGFLAAFRSQTDPRQVYCHFIGVDPRTRGGRIGEALYQRLFADAEAAGCSEVLSVTSPENAGSIAFHRRMGFDLLPGPCTVHGVPFSPEYDGPGEDRVRFRKSLRITGSEPSDSID